MVSTDERFLLDVMLGKLATYLRMVGYDTAYALDRGVEADDELLALAEEEDRRLVTRDRQVAEQADDALLLTGRAIEDQLDELSAAGVALALDRPRRCAACNGQLDRLPPVATTEDAAPDPSEHPVWRCRRCGQSFWRGSHWDDVAERLERVRDTPPGT
ncbi:MAG: Mut7-C RNAse domain-containing protein [Halobacteriales archaeon]